MRRCGEEAVEERQILACEYHDRDSPSLIMEDSKIAASHKRAMTLAARVQAQTARAIARAHTIKLSAGSSSKSGSSFSAGFNLARTLTTPSRGPKTPIQIPNKDGLQTFHFSITPISRASDLTLKISSSTKTLSSASSDSSIAASHQRYIERDAALERLPENVESFIDAEVVANAPGRTPEKNKMLGPGEEGYAPAAANYIERAAALENPTFGSIAATLEELKWTPLLGPGVKLETGRSVW